MMSQPGWAPWAWAPWCACLSLAAPGGLPDVRPADERPELFAKLAPSDDR